MEIRSVLQFRWRVTNKIKYIPLRFKIQRENKVYIKNQTYIHAHLIIIFVFLFSNFISNLSFHEREMFLSTLVPTSPNEIFKLILLYSGVSDMEGGIYEY